MFQVYNLNLKYLNQWLLLCVEFSVLGFWSCASPEPAKVMRRTPESELPVPAGNLERIDDVSKVGAIPSPSTNLPSGAPTTQAELPKPIDSNPPKTDVATSTATTQNSDKNVVPVTYDGFFYPLKMKECLEQGKIYDRATLDCHVSQTIATLSNGFDCTKAGIVTAFGESEVVSQQLDLKAQSNWKIDQCGFETNQKKVVSLVCFTDKSQTCNAQPSCKDPKDLDPKETRFCISLISES